MEFKLLGPLEAWRDGARVAIGGPRQQVTLAMLLLEPDRMVPSDRLIEAVWDEEPPATARAQIQICISSLRRALGTGPADPVIETLNPGYLLRLGESSIDVRAFEESVLQARREAGAGDVLQAAQTFRAALALWRGPMLSSVDSTLIRRAVTQFDERRLAVLEECLAAELAAGRTQDVIGELVKLSHENPLRERAKVLLMTALYRSGRQAEALEVYRIARAELIDQLGIEPGEELRKLQQAILNGDPEPAGPPPVVVAAAAAAGPARPRTLPSTIADFTGRSAIIGSVLASVNEDETGYSVPVNVLFGPGGTGKTTLAIHIAHQLAERFPDGQLYARLRAGDQAVSPADILGRFLRALGTQGSALPDSVEERAEMYRDLTGGRKVLIVLDDAMSESQVSLLVPGSPSCSVLITSRRRLAALPVANRSELKVMSHASSVDLLAKILGADRVRAEHDAVDALCRLCGHLPLTLRIVAARLASRPHWTVADMVDRLRDETERLNELSRGELGLRASLRVSYDDLSEQARRLLRRLAISDAPNYAPWIGAPLLDTSVRRAEDIMEELAEAYLIDIEEGPPGEPVRYRFHDMMRPFAREELLGEEPAAERREVLERLVKAFLFLAIQAHRREYSGEYLLPSSEVEVWPLPEDYTDRLLGDPLAWFERERLAIVANIAQAAASGMSEHTWNMALCAVTLFESRSYFSEWYQTHDIALQAAVKAADRRGEAAMRYSLGSLDMFELRNDTAQAQLEAAARIFTELGDRHGAGLALRNIAVIDRRAGRLDEAIERGQSALEMLREVGDRVAEAHTLHNLAQVWLDYGRDDTAGDLLDRAAQICEEVGNRRVYAQVQRQLGDLRLRVGRVEEAAESFSVVLEIVQDADDKVGEGYALIGLAYVDLRRERPEAAIKVLREAALTTGAVGNPLLENRIELALAEAELLAGDLAAAEEHADRVLLRTGGTSARLLTVQALTVRGRVHREAGRTQAARQAWQEAVQTLSALGLRRGVAMAEELNELLKTLTAA
ncbi:tetratricopeptide repeat protein [Catenulispora sp. NF23]|uniref:AfsR/SARP family transcriptional regulator n=1 Tax=Catenulispora pinistramenti TaxID=2705254 RepID=UPI001BA62A67|nr:BTAD domain-containing putative transcriptional regulator [Catenulispora pinistramenti]MBS2532130.1 tetratricopeptide repeat protein [Catenulispora pinistramenti]